MSAENRPDIHELLKASYAKLAAERDNPKLTPKQEIAEYDLTGAVDVKISTNQFEADSEIIDRESYLEKHNIFDKNVGRKGRRIQDHGTRGLSRDRNFKFGFELEKWKIEKAKYWRNFERNKVEDGISGKKYEEMMSDEARDLCDEEDWDALMALDPNKYDPSKDFKTSVRRGADPSIPWFGRSRPEVGRFGTSDRRGSRKVRPDAYIKYWYGKNGNI